jgi:hypothetical protein
MHATIVTPADVDRTPATIRRHAVGRDLRRGTRNQRILAAVREDLGVARRRS